MSRRLKREVHSPKKPVTKFFFLFVFGALSLLLLVGSGSFLWQMNVWAEELPSIEVLRNINATQKTRIYADDGETVLSGFFIEDRLPVELGMVSPYLVNATVATEDTRFWSHNGVDPIGMLRAVLVNATGADMQGASTITQQLVRQTLLKDEMTEATLKRKGKEAMLSIETENSFSKESILSMYLNSINYGDGTWGIQSAAQHYFSKDAQDLTLIESALLAGIPQNPTYNNPVEYPQSSLIRRNHVLGRMLADNYISQSEHDAAVKMPLELNIKAKDTTVSDYGYEYFSSYVRDLLNSQYSSEFFFQGGLNVYTSLNIDIQAEAERVCEEKESRMDEDVEVSLVSIEPDTGQIKAMRGGKSYAQDQFNTAVDMKRAAGSTFKVFGLVGAIEEGFSPYDVTISGSSPAQIGDWRPTNYGEGSYGNMTLAQATQMSVNTVYARLVEKLGAGTVVEVAHRMGVKSNLDATGPVILGASGVNTLEMASAYSTLATGGKYNAPTAIVKIVDSYGVVLFEAEPTEQYAVSSSVAFATTKVLKTVVTSGTATGANLGSAQESAGKTGTSDDYRDSWYVGYTPQLSTAIWIGSRSNRSITDNVGGTNCCPLWKAFMQEALKQYPSNRKFHSGTEPRYDNRLGF